jgi:L-rhamnose isomerase
VECSPCRGRNTRANAAGRRVRGHERPRAPAALRAFAAEHGLTPGTTNSNTFEEQPGHAHSYTFGRLSQIEAAVRDQAVAHNLHGTELGVALVAPNRSNGVIMALATLEQAFTTDVVPILALARHASGGAVNPVAVYRDSRYRQLLTEERPAPSRRGGGIV